MDTETLTTRLERRLTPLAFGLFVAVTRWRAAKKTYVSAREVASAPVELFKFLRDIIPRQYTHDSRLRTMSYAKLVLAGCKYPECLNVFGHIITNPTPLLYRISNKCLRAAVQYGNLPVFYLIAKYCERFKISVLDRSIIKDAIKGGHLDIVIFIDRTPIFSIPYTNEQLFQWALESGNTKMASRIKHQFRAHDSCYFRSIKALIPKHQLNSIKYCIKHCGAITESYFNKWIQHSKRLNLTYIARYFERVRGLQNASFD